MKKILFIPVGGTICTSSDNEGMLSVNPQSGYLIKSNYENSDSPFAKCIEFDVTDNLMILSENMTVSKWNLMFDTYRNNISKKDYDGVIFAHGTDTLAYSAALFSILASESKIPVFFVSANKSLEQKDSNGNDNFKAAAELICYGIEPGVYVTYKNISDGKMYIHSAQDIEQCRNYSDDFFSRKMTDISDLSSETHKEVTERIKNNLPHLTKLPFNLLDNSAKLRDCVLCINPYVGIRYDAYDYQKFDAVLHKTFHSGTVCSDGNDAESVLFMIDRCNNEKTDVYFSPAKDKGATYNSVVPVRNCKNVHFLYGYTDEYAYARLLVAYSFFNDEEKRTAFIKTPSVLIYFSKDYDTPTAKPFQNS